MDKKSVKVKCSFCGKEIECPEDMLKEVEKHACADCFRNIRDNLPEEEIKKLHVDMPLEELNDDMAEGIADKLVEDEFSSVWQDSKNDFKEMSKKEVAEEMFWQGAYMAMVGFLEMLRMKEEGGEEDDEPSESKDE